MQIILPAIKTMFFAKISEKDLTSSLKISFSDRSKKNVQLFQQIV